MFCIDAGGVGIYESKERIILKMRKIHVETQVFEKGNRVLQFSMLALIKLAQT